MVLEHAVLSILPGREKDFELAVAEAQDVIASSPGFAGLKLSRGVENPGTYLLQIEWASPHDHTPEFRESSAYAPWDTLLRSFCAPFPVIGHFSPVLGTSPRVATAHLLCGLNGAGKTTLARKLEADVPAARFSLDAWMIGMYPGLSIDAPDYGPLAETCKLLIWNAALGTLRAGTDVVLDWNQWNRVRRAEWAARVRDAGFNVLLHHVRVPVETAITQAAQRNSYGDPEAHALTAEGIRHVAGIFEAPETCEGLPLTVHDLEGPMPGTP